MAAGGMEQVGRGVLLLRVQELLSAGAALFSRAGGLLLCLKESLAM